MTMIVVTHEMAFAEDVADVALIMDRGAIVEQGPPSQVPDRSPDAARPGIPGAPPGPNRPSHGPVGLTWPAPGGRDGDAIAMSD